MCPAAISASQILIVCLFLITPLFVSAQATLEKFSKDSIREEKFILINGIEQWVTIKGARSKPIILFLHGGPGSPLSPYSDALFKAWEKDFIIVQWDQRGTGRTYGVHAPEELTPAYLKANPLTVEQMTSDGIALSEYLIKSLGKQKIILFGTSWGSVLGVEMATRRPELFYAYIGHAQVVNPSSNLKLYEKVYQIATKTKDHESLETLNAIGKPPYDRAKKVGQLLRVVKKYESAHSTPAPEAWFEVSAAYDNPKDNQNRSDGDDYSFVNYTGDIVLGVQSMSANIDFMKDRLEFKIPVYFIQGKEDLLTPKESTKKYFKNLKAPEKKYILLPESAHGFNGKVLDALYKIGKGKVVQVEILDAAVKNIIDETVEIEVIATGFDWSEGPLWLPDSKTLLFSDVPKNVIHSWTEAGGVKKYLEPSGYTGSVPREGEMGSNGLALSNDNKLLLCQHGDRKVVAMNAPLTQPKPEFITLADNFGGKKFNSPNDMAVRNNGDLYFTDPPYGLPGLDSDSAKETPFNGVYRISKGKVTLLVDTLTKPNGIAFLPDGKTFIVANSDGAKPIWYAFDVDERDSVYNARIFYNAKAEFDKVGGGPDGLKVDKNGNVFATGPGGIWIFNQHGKVLGKINLEGRVSNCAFGADEKTLFVTNADKVLRIKLRK